MDIQCWNIKLHLNAETEAKKYLFFQSAIDPRVLSVLSYIKNSQIWYELFNLVLSLSSFPGSLSFQNFFVIFRRCKNAAMHCHSPSTTPRMLESTLLLGRAPLKNVTAFIKKSVCFSASLHFLRFKIKLPFFKCLKAHLKVTLAATTHLLRGCNEQASIPIP